MGSKSNTGQRREDRSQNEAGKTVILANDTTGAPYQTQISVVIETVIERANGRLNGLEPAKRRLAKQIAVRQRAGSAVIANAIRLAVGVVWLIVGGVLIFDLPRRSAGMSALGAFSGVPDSDLGSLSRLFVFIGVIMVAFSGLAVAWAYARARHHRAARQAAENLGHDIAEAAHTLKRDLDVQIGHVVGERPARDAVKGLVGAHHMAVEASLFYSKLGFVTDNSDRALGDFDNFLGRGGAPAPAVLFLMGFIIGTILTGLLFMPKAGLMSGSVDTNLAPDLFRYGGFALLFLVGVVITLFSGLLAELVFPPFRVTKRAILRDALDAMRRAQFVAKMPNLDAMVHELELAQETLLSRLGRHEANAGAKKSAASGKIGAPADMGGFQERADKANDQDGPDKPFWRHRKDRLDFVDTGFQAIPPVMRREPRLREKESPRADSSKNRR